MGFDDGALGAGVNESGKQELTHDRLQTPVVWVNAPGLQQGLCYPTRYAHWQRGEGNKPNTKANPTSSSSET